VPARQSVAAVLLIGQKVPAKHIITVVLLQYEPPGQASGATMI
jgi:hypothetical protein